MAFATMHFAVGMAGGGALAVGANYLTRGHVRWRTRWIPAAMTFGGIWATLPDYPRMVRESFATLPWLAYFGNKGLDQFLNTWGNVFFFHRALDIQPHEYAIHGMLGMLILYNLSIFLIMPKNIPHLKRSTKTKVNHHAQARQYMQNNSIHPNQTDPPHLPAPLQADPDRPVIGTIGHKDVNNTGS